MNEEKDNHWVDELIHRTINTTKPDFDPEKWKQKYPDEFQVLVSRASNKQSRRASAAESRMLKVIFKSPLVRIAVAAVLVMAASLLLVYTRPGDQIRSATDLQVVKSPAEMVTGVSLIQAYRRGGMEGMEQQFEKALKMLGPRPTSLSLSQLYKDFNG